MERFQNIKASIANAKNIKIIFPENPDNDILGSVLALYSAFNQLDKKVFLIEGLPEKAVHFLRNEKKRIAITLNEEVAEIYYEKKGNHVDLNIVPKNQDFDSDNFSWEIVSEKKNNEQTEPLDIIIIIGVLRFKEVEKYLPTDEEELFACTIINIDKNFANENYGDVNIIENSPLSKIIAVLIKELNEFSFSKEVFDFLLFGFFSQRNIPIKDISVIKWLVNNSGTFDVYFEFKKEPKPIWAQYLEMAIKNISIQEDGKMIFSYLPIDNDNREKIKNILQVSKIFREWINPDVFFLSFKEENITKTIFYSINQLVINKIKAKYKGNFKETGGIITTNKEPRETMEELKEISF
ncbi:MAG: hypothetical protein PHR47_01675 [Candidatus Pacebacteria bacterium]|nr:hypothetical protein [Candidatus Paceibacterota bacterium]